jgi:hypothetical protein
LTAHPVPPRERGVIQIAPGHRWAGHFAVVDKVKPAHVVAFVLMPENHGRAPKRVYMRLDWDEFEALGVDAPWVEEMA